MRMKLVSYIERVPPLIFKAARSEAIATDFDRFASVQRGLNPVFSTSKSIALRRHDAPPGLTVAEYGNIEQCVNTELRPRFPCLNLLVSWMMRVLDGDQLGRIQLIELAPAGIVDLHTDYGTYFERHRRYHVPLLTNAGVVFFDDAGAKEHMEEGGLYRLANLGLHGVRNESTHRRIHLVADIRVGEHQ